MKTYKIATMRGGLACHLTTVHSPDDVRIYQKEARSLAEAGYDVTLVAPALKEARLEGVRWLRLRRPRGRLDRLLRLTPLAYRAALDSGAEVVHLHDPELLFVGLALKLRGRKVVWDAHEDLPRQILSKPWLPRPLRRPLAWAVDVLERTTTRAFDAVVAATPAIARRFPRDLVHTVQNYPILSQMLAPHPAPYRNRQPHVAYIGGISAIRGAREMVQAMEIAGRRWGARLLLAGRFTPESLEDELWRLPGWRYIDYVGWLDRERVAEALSRVRAGLVLFHPEPNHVNAQPNKIFEYMAAGLPVIASDFPLWRDLVAGNGAGLLANPLNPEAIAEAIGWVIEHPAEAEAMGRRGREAVRERYNWDREKEKLLALYRELLPQ